MNRSGKNTRAADFGGFIRALLRTVAVSLALRPASLLACAACYGQSDSPMAKGMNWGILSLLGVIALVLGGVAAFFVYLARRAALVSTATAAQNQAPLSGVTADPRATAGRAVRRAGAPEAGCTAQPA